MVSYRGQSGLPLHTPKLYNALSIDDIGEPIDYVFDKYCAPKNQRAFAMGCSMGANILSNYLGIKGEETKLSGGVCVQAAIKKWAGVETFESSLGGVYNRSMGKWQFDYIRSNLDLLQPHFMENYAIDLEEQLSLEDETYTNYH
mmetsp:Transcript_2075/g.3667  ORF Transcript_2075/g.3667 Transcript_2075/m.3667 type:complete len:144 (+) Transcript_2075:1392-1823(+)